jgi:O-antigen/teichoic acid export membrane protein
VSSDIGSRLAKNSTYNLLRVLITVPVTLCIWPYIVRHLGKEEFGIWALVGVISSYAQLSDFGITEGLVKFVAEYDARDDSEGLNRLVNTVLCVYVFLSIAGSLVFTGLLPLIVDDILKIPALLREKALHTFFVAILLFFGNMVLGVFGSLIIGFQRMGYSNLISIVSTILTACGTIVFLNAGFGLPGLVYNNAIVSVVIAVANLVAAKRLFPSLHIAPFRLFSRTDLAKIFSFSWKVQLTNITQLMIFQIDRVLLSHYVGLSAVSYYEIANRIASQARMVIATMFSPMIPAASALHALSDETKMAGLYRRSLKYMVVAAVPCSAVVIVLAGPFVRTWIGPGYETSALTMQLLMGVYFINLLTGPGGFIMSGINRPEVGMRSSIMAGLINLTVCFVLVKMIGYYGIIIGLFASVALSGGYFVWMLHQAIPDLSWNIYPRAMTRPLLISTLLVAIMALLNNGFSLEGYLLLCLTGGGFCVIYLFAILQGDYFDQFDRTTLMRLVPPALRKV